MLKGPQGQKRSADVIGNTVMVAQIATGEREESGYKPSAKHKSGLARFSSQNKILSAKKSGTAKFGGRGPVVG